MWYSCVLFDIDNTLFDTQPLLTQCAELCDGLATQRESREHRALRLRCCRRHARLFDDTVPDVLKSLAACGVCLGVVSAAPRPYVVALLEATGLRRFFDRCLITAETCSRSKPEPMPLRRALQMLGHPPRGGLYVGDAPEDALASRRAGMHFGLAGWARRERAWNESDPDVVLQQFRDLLGLCRA